MERAGAVLLERDGLIVVGYLVLEGARPRPYICFSRFPLARRHGCVSPAAASSNRRRLRRLNDGVSGGMFGLYATAAAWESNVIFKVERPAAVEGDDIQTRRPLVGRLQWCGLAPDLSWYNLLVAETGGENLPVRSGLLGLRMVRAQTASPGDVGSSTGNH